MSQSRRGQAHVGQMLRNGRLIGKVDATCILTHGAQLGDLFLGYRTQRTWEFRLKEKRTLLTLE